MSVEVPPCPERPDGAHCWHATGRGGLTGHGGRTTFEVERQCCRCGRMGLLADPDAQNVNHGRFLVTPGAPLRGGEVTG